MRTADEIIRLLSGQGIRDMRVARGWSQEQFAREAGVSPSTVQRWEKGGARPGRLAARELERIARQRKGRKEKNDETE